MTNKHKHQIHALVFSSQSHSGIEQILASSGPVQTAQRTESGGVACRPRSHPLDAANGISRVSARLPADQAGEWPDHLTHIDPHATGNIRTRPDSAATHSRLSASIGGRASHARLAVTLLQFDSIRKTASRANTQRPDTGTNSHPSGHTTREHTPIDPDNFRKAFMPAKRPPRGVRQDKYAPERVRRASLQAVTAKQDARTRRADAKSARVQKHSNRQTVQVAGWIKPALRAELETIARKSGLTLSRTIAALLEEAVRQQLHVQHAVLLQPIIEQAIARQMRSYSGRIAILLVRSLFASEQTRSLVTNILGRQQGITQPVLREILNSSGRSAKRNITNITPQLAALVEDIQAWMEKEEGEDNKHA